MTFSWKTFPPLRPAVLASMATATLALGVAGAGLFLPSGTGRYSAEQVQSAKSAVCDGVAAVRKSNTAATTMHNPEAGSKAGALATAANARLALGVGGAYLNRLVESNPAAPGGLRDAVSGAGDTMLVLSVNYLGGASATGDLQAPLRARLAEQMHAVAQECGAESDG